MKKMLYTALLAVFGLSSSAYAQFTEGTISVGGGASLTSHRSEATNQNVTVKRDPTTTFKLRPSVGYFFRDDLEAGVQFGYSRISTSGEMWGESYTQVESMVSLGPYVRKYFSLGETTAFFGEAGFSFGSGKTVFDYERNNSREFNKRSHFRVGITPGVVFRPAERFGVELSAGFLGFNSWETSHLDGDKDRSSTSSNFGLTLDMSSVQLGVRLYLGN